MRIDVHKYLFMGATKNKETFFRAAQEAGIIEFINPKGQKRASLPADIEKMLEAIKILRKYVQEEQDGRKEFEKAPLIADQIIELKIAQQEAEQKLHDVENGIERILPFGEFSPEHLHELEKEIKRKIRFFCAKSTKHMNLIERGLILIRQRDGVDYFIAIQNEPIVSVDLEELHFEASLSDLESEQKQLLMKIETTEAEIKKLNRYNLLLHQALIHRINQTNLQQAQETIEFELENQLFFAEGWVPIGKIANVKDLSEKYHVYFEEIAVESHDVVPTYLENQGPSKVGEDLIRIFDTPSNRDKDPSIWVLFAFALFFSMIVYDAGYGLIFLATALILRLKGKNFSYSAKRFVTLMMLLGTCCVVWGGLTHSIFGIPLAPDNFIRKHSMMTWLLEKKADYHMQKKDDVYEFYLKQYPELATAKTPDQFLYVHGPEEHGTPIAEKFTGSILLELSLFIGAVHIILGLCRYLRFNYVGAGWIAFILGSYLYLPYYLNATSIIHFVFGINREHGAEFGLHLLIFGLVLTTILAIVQHGILGSLEWIHSIQIFADILSYLRLYALAYASFIVSETINDLSLKLPLLFCIMVIIVGHLVNIILAIMLGAIHGLRLNFLEWYRYSFYGGGKEFRPLQLQTLE